MSTRWTLGVAVTAAALGAVAGYIAALHEFAQQPEGPGQGDDGETGSARERVIRVSPRQVQAARVAIEARKLLGEPVPPGLQRIANAGKSRPDREYEFYARPDGQMPQGPPRQRSPRSTSERAAVHATEEACQRLELQYGLYSGAEMGQRLGYRSHRRRVEAQRSAGRLLGVRRGSSLRYPGLQVSPDGKLAPVIGDLIALAREYGWSDESLALWLANPSGSMPDDRAPAELLHDDPQLVLEAARRVMQPVW